MDKRYKDEIKSKNLNLPLYQGDGIDRSIERNIGGRSGVMKTLLDFLIKVEAEKRVYREINEKWKKHIEEQKPYTSTAGLELSQEIKVFLEKVCDEADCAESDVIEHIIYDWIYHNKADVERLFGLSFDELEPKGEGE